MFNFTKHKNLILNYLSENNTKRIVFEFMNNNKPETTRALHGFTHFRAKKQYVKKDGGFVWTHNQYYYCTNLYDHYGEIAVSIRNDLIMKWQSGNSGDLSILAFYADKIIEIPVDNLPLSPTAQIIRNGTKANIYLLENIVHFTNDWNDKEFKPIDNQDYNPDKYQPKYLAPARYSNRTRTQIVRIYDDKTGYKNVCVSIREAYDNLKNLGAIKMSERGFSKACKARKSPKKPETWSFGPGINDEIVILVNPICSSNQENIWTGLNEEYQAGTPVPTPILNHGYHGDQDSAGIPGQLADGTRRVGYRVDNTDSGCHRYNIGVGTGTQYSSANTIQTRSERKSLYKSYGFVNQHQQQQVKANQLF